MDVDSFIAEQPYIYHMAQSGSWPQMSREGLLSTTALLDLYRKAGEERRLLESCHRPHSMTITHPDTGGSAVIRDNAAMNEDVLRDLLTGGMKPPDWYRHLNRRVFFWVHEENVLGLLCGRNYRNLAHDVITVCTRRLVERDYDRITISAINSGCVLAPNHPQRGPDTFVAIPDAPFEAWCKRYRRRGPGRGLMELTVDYKVEHIENVAIRVERRERGEVLSTLWSR